MSDKQEYGVLSSAELAKSRPSISQKRSQKVAQELIPEVHQTKFQQRNYMKSLS